MITSDLNILASTTRQNVVFGVAGLNKLTGIHWVFCSDDQSYTEHFFLPVRSDDPVVMLTVEYFWLIGTPSRSCKPTPNFEL